MRDMPFILLLLACPLSMLAMGAVAWLTTKIVPGRKEQATTSQSANAE
jgi:hypothetical protein